MPSLSLTETDNNQSFNVLPGENIVVRLDESPTTGYRWAIDHLDNDVIAHRSDDFSSAGGGIGGGGERIFSFRAQKAGSTEIRLKLWRDWQGDASAIKRFKATINVG